MSQFSILMMRKKNKRTERIFALFLLPIFLAQMLSFDLLFLGSAVFAQTEPNPVVETASETLVKEENPAPVKVDPPKEENLNLPVAIPEEQSKDIIKEEIATEKTAANDAVEVLPVDKTAIAETEKEPAVLNQEQVPVEKLAPQEVQAVEKLTAPEKSVPVWSMTNDGKKATTTNPVELGKKYVFPEDDQVTVTFTKLPENPGTLSIEKIRLTDEQVKSFGAFSNTAFDITSSMEDGTFEYDLTLPKPKDKKTVQIKYAESVSELDDAKTISKDEVKTKTNSVGATLDHFTIFFASITLPPAANPVVTTLNITMSAFSVVAGQNKQFDAIVLDQNGAVMFSPIKWASSAPLIGTINETSGIFTALSAGTTTITASSGALSSSIDVSVTGSVTTIQPPPAPAGQMTIVASAMGGGSIAGVGISGPGGVYTVGIGTSQMFRTVANAGNYLVDVIVNGVSVGPQSLYQFINVSSNQTIIAVFAAIPTYQMTINASATAGGTITPSGISYLNYNQGNINYIFKADPGYHFVKTTINGVDDFTTVNGYNAANLKTDMIIIAVFAPDTATNDIIASAGLGGTISPLGTNAINYGANTTFNILPDPGFQIDTITVDGTIVPSSAAYTFTSVIKPHTITVTFIASSFNLTSSATAGGTISPLGTMALAAGASQTYAVSPDPGFVVDSVLFNGVSIPGAVYSPGGPAMYTVKQAKADSTVQAIFVPNAYDIISSAGPNGTISPLGTNSVARLSSATYTITPNANYHVADVLVDGVSVGAVTTYSFAGVNAPHTIDATFAINMVDIVASAGLNGTISPLGTTTVPYGGSQAYTITPNSGYTVGDVLVNGISVGAVTSYTVSNITSPATISATFVLNPTISISPSPLSVTTGATQQFAATAFDSLGVPLAIQPTFIWSSDNAAVGTVNASTGFFTAVSAGTVVVTAASGALSASATVTVTPPALYLNSIQITPANSTVVTGASQQFSAIGYDQFGAPLAIQPMFVWSNTNVSSPFVGVINPLDGMFSAITAGTAVVTATSGTVSGTMGITVVDPILTTINVTPANAGVNVGGTLQMSAATLDQFGAAMTPASALTWSSSDIAVATVDVNGLVTGAGNGTAVITATDGVVSGTTTITVTQLVLTTINLAPASPAINVGATQQMSASTLDQFGTAMSPTPTLTWSSSNTAVATVDANGLVIGVGQGTATITATSGTVSGATSTSVSQVAISTPVYRFWSSLKQHHFYTASAAEKDQIIATYPTAVWGYERVAWNAFSSQQSGTMPVYRFWSNTKQTHFYTISAAEKDYIIATYPTDVWNYETIAYYAYPSQQPNTTPVYRFWSDTKQGHFYTASAAEKDQIIATYPSNVWSYERIAYFVPIN